ncbi:alpha/beta fold hydrolase [Acinetobacter sp. ANC 4648]|uniref:alpha/beta fold hydrolase n=1 Tax=Acinetobacter sp. ANC 4648 TaxID=1977875 RepID=UPI000A32E498|nr:alpha/beta hydrolase [Acinetobacter sp. ANC 4648]OTG83784.1 alpha/beta hydrolase [Acinetobacter sp. ANC 4648]
MLHLLTQKILQILTTSALSLAAATMLICSTPSSAVAEVAEYIDYQKILQEERAWAGLSTKTIRVGDVVWSYSEGGAKNKPTILLIHGLASSRDTWNEVAHQLTPYYHVIIPDLPSSGSTIVPANFDLSVPNVTEQLRRFVEAAHIQNKLNIAGHSLGGSIAMFYASQYPFDTQSLFLISSGGLFQNNNTNYLKNPIYLKQLLVSQPGDLDFVLKKVMYSPPFTSSVIKREQEKILISRASETAKIINQITELNKLYTPNSFAKMVKEIEAPTLILWGKQDQIVNVEVVQDLKGLLKRPDTPIILNNVGHMPILEAPERVSMSYLSFLEKTQHQNNSLSEHYMNK